MFIILFIYPLYALPISDATHRVDLSITVDGVSKGNISLGLFENQAPKSVAQFLNACTSITNNASISKIVQGERLELDFRGPLQSWSSEVNDLPTELGALGQKRDTESGQVSTVWTLFGRRMEYDGKSSQWLVIGAILTENDRRLIEYLDWTGGDGEPLRSIKIQRCSIQKLLQKTNNNSDL